MQVEVSGSNLIGNKTLEDAPKPIIYGHNGYIYLNSVNLSSISHM